MRIFLLMISLTHADVSVAKDAPSEWAEACRAELLTTRDQWNRDHPADLLPEPGVSVARTHRQWPHILVQQYFFRGVGQGGVQINWREPWSAKLSSVVHPAELTSNAAGWHHWRIIRSEVRELPRNDWFPPGSRYGTATGYSERDNQLVKLFWPAVERCVRR